MKQRLGILQMHDDQGIADDFLLYLADKLREQVSRLVIVCNGPMQDDSLRKLRKYTTDIFIRPDEGFDCTAIKETMSTYLGWEQVQQYDQLVLVNDSNYGPFYPLESVFREMEGRDADFWSITDQVPVRSNVKGYDRPYYCYHLRPDFLVVNKRLLQSRDFIQFWEELPAVADHNDAVLYYELRLTEYWTKRGYRSGVYTVLSDMISEDCDENYIFIYEEPYLLVSQGCPFVKRKAFSQVLWVSLGYSNGQSLQLTLSHIEEHTDYDVDMIWKNQIRTQNVADIRDNMHLNFVLPSRVRNAGGIPKEKKIAVIAHLNYTDLIEGRMPYLCNIPKGIDLIITTKGEENQRLLPEILEKNGIENYRIVVPYDRGREISGLLVACRDLLMQYDYLCFTHDKKSQKHIINQSVGRTFMDILWENTLGSTAYIENAIACLEEHPRLGFLAPPIPYHSIFFNTIKGTWGADFANAKALVERLGLQCQLSEEKPYFAVGTAFWCRTAALKALFTYNFSYEDFEPEPMPVATTISHAIERIFPYVAQHEGYYSGVMMTDRFAGECTINYEYMLAYVMRLYDDDAVVFSQFVLGADSVKRIEEFAQEHERLYIYGAAGYGMQCYKFLERMCKDKNAGFIVSKGHRPKDFPYPVKELPEVTFTKGDGLILAMDIQHQRKVLPDLYAKAFYDVISYI